MTDPRKPGTPDLIDGGRTCYSTYPNEQQDRFGNPREPIDHDDDMFDDEPDDSCTDPGGHQFVCTGTQYGGDDESYHGEGRCYCIHCGADGDA